MDREFHSLKFRLPTSFVLMFAAIQLLLWAAVSVVVNNHLHARFDHELLNQALSILDSYETASQEEFHLPAAERFRKIIKPLEPRGSYILVHLTEGQEFVRSANLRGTRFPYAPPQPAPQAPRFETLSGTLAETLERSGQLRLVTLEMDAPRGYLQVAESLAPIGQLQGNLRWLMFIFLIVSVVVAAIAATFVTHKVAAPLTAIAERARALSSAQVHEPIPVPRTRDEVAELATAFNVMLRRLGNEFANQQAFISSAAHELRTPLAVLLTSVQTEKKRAADEREQSFLESAEEEVRRLLRTVESFMLLTRVRSGRRLEVITDVSIDDVVMTAVHTCHERAVRSGVRLSPRLEDHGMPEPIVRGDEDLLVTVVENLLSNAIRYTPNGGAVDIETSSSAKEVRIAVRDRGPGIPPEHRPRVFDLFYQVDTQSRKAGKAGIGLAIVRAVCELHGGSVTIQDRAGGGAEFQVRLPIAQR